MFKERFDNYVCVGDIVECEIGGITYTATIHQDHDYSIDDDDCHSTDQSVTGCDDDQFARLMAARDSFNDEWFYCGVVISATNSEGWTKSNIASLWGIECNYPESSNDYLLEVANTLLNEILSDES